MNKNNDVDIIGTDIKANRLASVISHYIADNGTDSFSESLIMLVSAVCKVAQALSLIMGVDPKELKDTIIFGIEKFFDLGGDPMMEEAFKELHEKDKESN